MPVLFDLPTRLVGERPLSTFAVLLVVHIAAGLTAVMAGATAMLSPKRSGPHPKPGRTYYTARAAVCATATGMAAMRWPEDTYLVVQPDRLAAAVATIGSSALQMNGLIDGLLDAACLQMDRAVEIRPRAMDLVGLAGRAVKELASRAIVIPSGCPRLWSGSKGCGMARAVR
jgi:hypothetical protein